MGRQRLGATRTRHDGPDDRRAAGAAAHIRSIAAGELHALATDVDGRLWAWGWNSYEQLGLTVVQYETTPQLVVQLPATLGSAGGQMATIALRGDGSVWAMGAPIVNSLPSTYTLGIQVAGFTTGDQAALTGDQDGDGLSTWSEFTHGTDPLNPDSNGNGVGDLAEINLPGAGLNSDEDGDGLASTAEALRGTDPFITDTDGDGVSDGADAFPLDPTRSAAPNPDPADTTPPVITLTYPTNAVPVP